MLACLKVKKTNDKDETFFTKNGGRLLEELIAFSNGRSNPIRHFSAKELLTATNNYDASQIIVHDSGYRMYKGSLKDRPICVKKYDYRGPLWRVLDFSCKDIVVGSQMSVHKNVLKVLGCCLDTEIPTIVYEFAGEVSLSRGISRTNVQPLPWKCRLKIATDIANVVAYLHTGFSRPVVHRDIRCPNFILNQNNIPKLIDFGLCIPIPEGKSHVEDDVLGRMGFIAPEYMATGYLTEKVDVYNFGMLLLELLSGQKPSYEIMGLSILGTNESCVENFRNVVDPRITNEIQAEQLLDFATLILRCFCKDGEERPTIIEVAKELKRIIQCFPSP